jgi:hypothetical protein
MVWFHVGHHATAAEGTRQFPRRAGKAAKDIGVPTESDSQVPASEGESIVRVEYGEGAMGESSQCPTEIERKYWCGWRRRQPRKIRIIGKE